MSMPIRNVDRKKWQTMKALYEKMKNTPPLSFGEIKNLFNVNDRTLHRYLAELEALGLISFENGKYHAKENRRVFSSKSEYEISLNHSQTLLANAAADYYSGLGVDDEKYMKWHPQTILEPLVTAPEKHSLLLQHLRFYDFFPKLEQYCALFKKYQFLRVSVPGEHPGLVGLGHFAALNSERLFEVPVIWAKIEGREVEFIPNLKEEGFSEEIRKDFLRLIELKNCLIKEFLHVIWLVENGVPLNGHCDACPSKHVVIKD